jgi:glutamate-1-semialdehyde 2,1-aminomutase
MSEKSGSGSGSGSRSKALFELAKKRIPGGVNSPVRAFKSVGGDPPFIASGKGAWIVDVDGREYVDYVLSWGPLILGHAQREVMQEIVIAAATGSSFGAPTEREVQLAELLCRAVPSMDKVRLVSSGTEATMSALRLARGFTRREAIVKIDGGYHGHADCLLVEAGSGVATLGNLPGGASAPLDGQSPSSLPGSAGVTAGTAKDTRVVAWNDLEAARAALAPGDVAAIIVEPVCGNMGCVPPRPGYLEGLRAATRDAGTLLIFDEVMTGFRVAFGGAQARYGITPDLTCLGKVVGGGMPLAAYGGRADVMALVAPDGPVYQAGTLSGNPIAVAAGLKTLELLQQPGSYEQLEKTSAAIVDGIGQLAREKGIPLYATRVGSMFTAFFTDGEVWSYADAKKSDTKRFAAWFRAMLARGVYLAPSQFEAGFVSTAHGEREVAHTLDAARAALAEL